MASIGSSCVFIPNRGPEGLTKLEIVTPNYGTAAAAADTVYFNKTKFGITRVVGCTAVVSNGTSQMNCTTTGCVESGDYVTITLPNVAAEAPGIQSYGLVYYITVIGTSRATHGSGGARLFGGGHI